MGTPVCWLCYPVHASRFAFNPCAVCPGQLLNVERWKEFAVEIQEQNVDGTVGEVFCIWPSPNSVIFMLKHHDYQGAFLFAGKHLK